MDRRTFFSSGLLGAVAMGAASLAASAGKDDISSNTTPKILNYHPAMRYRPMGNTGISVSTISLGGLVMAESVHRYAIEHGVNLVHVGWDYLGGQAIKTLGAVLKPVRDRVYIALKDDYPSIDEALKVLNTDHVDFLMFNRHWAFSARDAKIAETFEKLKNQGKVRFAGLHDLSRRKYSLWSVSGFDQVLRELASSPVGAQLCTTTRPERGHSCPQQRAYAQQAWDTGISYPYSDLAADRNVRAPVAVLNWAPPIAA